MEKYANMKTKCLSHKGLNHTEAGRGGGLLTFFITVSSLVYVIMSCLDVYE